MVGGIGAGERECGETVGLGKRGRKNVSVVMGAAEERTVIEEFVVPQNIKSNAGKLLA